MIRALSALVLGLSFSFAASASPLTTTVVFKATVDALVPAAAVVSESSEGFVASPVEIAMNTRQSRAYFYTCMPYYSQTAGAVGILTSRDIKIENNSVAYGPTKMIAVVSENFFVCAVKSGLLHGTSALHPREIVVKHLMVGPVPWPMIEVNEK